MLILIGTMMCGNAKDIPWDKFTESIPAFLTIVVMPFTFSIPNGLAAGLGSYIFMWIFTGGWQEWRNLRSLQSGYSAVDGSVDEGAHSMLGVVSERDAMLPTTHTSSPRLAPEEGLEVIPPANWNSQKDRPYSRNSFDQHIENNGAATQMQTPPRTY